MSLKLAKSYLRHSHFTSKAFLLTVVCALIAFSLAALRSPAHAYGPSAFVMRVKTDNPGTSSSAQFTIPIAGSGYSYDVDCNDDGINEATAQTSSYTCTYGAPGTYTLAITGVFPRIYFSGSGDRQKLLEVKQWGSGAWTSMSYAFQGASNLRITAADAPNLSNVTDMSSMFSGANSMNDDISHWDTSNVKNMSSMFATYSGNSSFNQPIGSWDTSKVTDMSRMFAVYNGGSSAFKSDLSGWNISNVANMTEMFAGAALPYQTYDAMLATWSAQTVKPGVNFHAGNSIYTNTTARSVLVSTPNNWTIIDSGYLQPRSSAFVMRVKTDNPGTSSSNQFTIPTNSSMFGGYTYSYNVDCDDDGTYDLTNATGSATCSYPSAGTYTVAIAGRFPQIYFSGGGDRQKLLEVQQWGSGIWASMESAFRGANNLRITATDAPNLSNITSMAYMFENATSLNDNINHWDVSSVASMSSMFSGASSFNQPLGSWNTANVTNMSYMFSGATAFNQPIGTWNTSKVTILSSMFQSAPAFNQPIGGWNTANVTNMSNMFGSYTANSSFNQPIGTWNTSKVTDMSRMFAAFNNYSSAFKADLSGWDVSKVTNMTDMFRGASLPYQVYDTMLASWSVQAVRPNVTLNAGNSIYTNAGARSVLTSAPNNWTIIDSGYLQPRSSAFVMRVKTDNPGTSTSTQFTIPVNAGTFSGNVYNYNVDCDDDGINDHEGVAGTITCAYASAGTYTGAITGTFPQIYFSGSGDRQKILEVQQWGSGAWRSMGNAFRGATNLRITATDAPNLSGVTDLSSMFSGATSMNDGISHWNTSNVTNMSSVFENATAFNQPLNAWNTSKVTFMDRMFSGATAFNQPLGSWNTASVTNMSYMFSGARAFNQPIGGWNTANVTNMTDMFATYSGNMNFNQPIGTWNTSKVTNMSGMFGARNGQTSAFKGDVSGWDVSKVTNMTDMFLGATIPYKVYDAILASWSVQPVRSSVNFHAGFSRYTNTAARSVLTSAPNNWIITDGGSNTARLTAFVMRVKTDNPGTSTSTQFTIPIVGTGYNYNVDCDDNGVNEVTARTTAYTCAYASAGTYTVAITGTFPQIYFNNTGDREKLLEVEQWGAGAWRSMSSAFYGATSLRITAPDAPNLSGVTDMSQMFRSATSMNDDISRWNTSNVTNMSSMLRGASSFAGDLSDWQIYRVTNMTDMFNGVTLPTQIYDSLLADWSAQPVQPNVIFHGGNSQYTNVTARNILTSAPNNWTIADAGYPAPAITAPTAGTTLVTNTPTITGTAVTGAMVDVTIAGQTLTVAADDDGNWSVVTGSIPDGTYEITAKVASSDLATVSGVTIVSPAPIITTPSPGTIFTTGNPTITGTAASGAIVAVNVGTQNLTATADNNGNWSVTATSLTDGTYTVVARVASSEVATVTVSIKLPVPIVQPDNKPIPTPQKPSARQVPVPTPSGRQLIATVEPDGKVTVRTPTIAVNGDKPIDQSPTVPRKPIFSGTATPGAQVNVTLTPADAGCEALADDNSRWQCILPEELHQGIYTIYTSITNPDGTTIHLTPYSAEVLGAQTEEEKKGPTLQTETSNQNIESDSNVTVIVTLTAGVLFTVAASAAFVRWRRNSVLS